MLAVVHTHGWHLMTQSYSEFPLFTLDEDAVDRNVLQQQTISAGSSAEVHEAGEVSSTDMSNQQTAEQTHANATPMKEHHLREKHC